MDGGKSEASRSTSPSLRRTIQRPPASFPERRLCACVATPNAAVDAQIKAQLTERLNHEEPDNRAALIGAAVTLYPEETVMLMEN